MFARDAARGADRDPQRPEAAGARAWATTGCWPTRPAEAIAALVAAAGPGSGSPLVSVELRHLGGALAAVRRAAFSLFAVGIVTGAEAAMAIDAALARCSPRPPRGTPTAR